MLATDCVPAGGAARSRHSLNAPGGGAAPPAGFSPVSKQPLLQLAITHTHTQARTRTHTPEPVYNLFLRANTRGCSSTGGQKGSHCSTLSFTAATQLLGQRLQLTSDSAPSQWDAEVGGMASGLEAHWLPPTLSSLTPPPFDCCLLTQILKH